ncbi:MAG TPA: hypothetical protein VD962_04355 [Rubricoccaceae bacterium]|nr:hypothetical protein [Rubricoccaceae bacterium]
MQQTLLAVVALLVFGTVALTMHQNNATAEHRAVAGDVDMAASDIASAYLIRALGRAYDEADTDSAAGLRITTVGLTTELGPEAGETLADFDDIDDFHGLATTDAISFEGTALPFDVSVAVRYVDPADPTRTSAVPTLAKEVIVTAVERDAAGNRPPARCSLRRVVTAAGQFFQAAP